MDISYNVEEKTYTRRKIFVTGQVSSRRAAEECKYSAVRRVWYKRLTRRTATRLVITAVRREYLTSYKYFWKGILNET